MRETSTRERAPGRPGAGGGGGVGGGGAAGGGGRRGGGGGPLGGRCGGRNHRWKSPRGRVTRRGQPRASVQERVWVCASSARARRASGGGTGGGATSGGAGRGGVG